MNRQRGAALLIALLILVLAVTAALLTAFNQRNSQAERDKITEAALAQAKAALTAWASVQGDLGSGMAPRPGNLPCPDTNDDGMQESSCVAGRIGRLPWKTLGIQELRDASGERLWYSISGNFRATNAAAINSDTVGTLQIYAADGASLLTPAGEELAAVVFAPGAPLAGQDRIAQPNAAASYLEAANTRDNRTNGGPFIAGPVIDGTGNVAVNDKLIGLSARELIRAVEQRVLRESRSLLESYYSTYGKYPNPASPSCLLVIADTSSPNSCDSDNTRCFGRLPENVFPSAPSWFTANGWGRTMIYAVDKSQVMNSSASDCAGSSGLQLDGVTKNYVVFAPGVKRGGQTRPSSNVTDYLEVSANQLVWGTDPDKAKLQTPTPLSSNHNDHVVSFP